MLCFSRYTIIKLKLHKNANKKIPLALLPMGLLSSVLFSFQAIHHIFRNLNTDRLHGTLIFTIGISNRYQPAGE